MAELLMILIFPLFPLWMTGGMDSHLEKTSEDKIQDKNVCVLGKTECVGQNVAGEKKENKQCEGHNLFSSEASYPQGIIPIKKDDSPNLKIWAGSSVVIDAESGTILHYDQGRKKTQIASLTKMMTAILVVENIQKLIFFQS